MRASAPRGTRIDLRADSLPAPIARPGLRQMTPLLMFTALYMCVYAGEAIKYAYLPIYMNEQLRLTPALGGAIIGVQPLVELLLMPVAVLVARRTGMIRLMILAAGATLRRRLA